MLVLSRVAGEEIIIGDNVRVQVVEIKGGKVRLGFSAPKDITVHRKEVWDKIQLENNNAESNRNKVA